jgi:hypothetical protein
LECLEDAEHRLIDLQVKLQELDHAIAARCADLLSQRESLKGTEAKWLANKAAAEQQLADIMAAREMTSVQTPLADLTLRKGQNSLKVDDESKVPPEFRRNEVVTVVDKVRLKAHLIAHPDDEVGAHLERGKSKLIVKFKDKKYEF